MTTTGYPIPYGTIIPDEDARDAAIDSVIAALNEYWNGDVAAAQPLLSDARSNALGDCTDPADWNYVASYMGADDEDLVSDVPSHPCPHSCRVIGCHRGCTCIAEIATQIC